MVVEHVVKETPSLAETSIKKNTSQDLSPYLYHLFECLQKIQRSPGEMTEIITETVEKIIKIHTGKKTTRTKIHTGKRTETTTGRKITKTEIITASVDHTHQKRTDIDQERIEPMATGTAL